MVHYPQTFQFLLELLQLLDEIFTEYSTNVKYLDITYGLVNLHVEIGRDSQTLLVTNILQWPVRKQCVCVNTWNAPLWSYGHTPVFVPRNIDQRGVRRAATYLTTQR